jgi:hypothetical protein
MRRNRAKLLSTTVIPFVVVGVAVGGALVTVRLAADPAYAAGASYSACAAGNPCSPCAGAPCNPCAAANPCDPCAAAACNPCNPCNPCAGGGSAGLKCAVPRLQAAAGNPCAVPKASSPCNPCAAGNPCNPCAAASNSCNPCAAAGPVQLTDAEAVAAYDCLLNEMRAAYAKSGSPVATSYSEWRRYSKNAYVSATHGNRYVQNYANPAAKAYGAFENAGVMPPGAVLAKDSFTVKANGRVSAGPLFIMEKMPAGFYDDSDDWRYTMVMPDGTVFGTTKGAGTAKVEFCIGCHISVAPDVDSLMFIPEQYRVY